MTKKKIVLIIDDDEGTQKILKFFIESLGYQAETKTNAISAKKWLSSSDKPDLILLDIMLPDITGIEFCRWINSQENTKEVPIIHMTAALTDEIAQEDSMFSGAKDFITKPPDFKILEKKIRMFLDK